LGFQTLSRASVCLRGGDDSESTNPPSYTDVVAGRHSTTVWPGPSDTLSVPCDAYSKDQDSNSVDEPPVLRLDDKELETQPPENDVYDSKPSDDNGNSWAQSGSSPTQSPHNRSTLIASKGNILIPSHRELEHVKHFSCGLTTIDKESERKQVARACKQQRWHKPNLDFKEHLCLCHVYHIGGTGDFE
jgi:hypothetical protein